VGLKSMTVNAQIRSAAGASRTHIASIFYGGGVIGF
jgi:hypothetical protein